MYKFPVLSFIVLFGASVILISNIRLPTDLSISWSDLSCNKENLSVKNTTDQCSKYHWNIRSTNSINDSLPIYDYIIFSKELDTLEIRLYELNDYVTLFFIAESRQTLTGQDKPLYLKENWLKFKNYHHKIRRVEVELVQNVTNPWDNEQRMRDEGLRRALSNITDHSYLLLTSDTDEIPKARFMHSLTHCQLPETLVPFVLQCNFYYYSYEFQNHVHKLFGTTITRVNANQSKQLSADALRTGRFHFHSIPESCYHCTWCFDQLKEVRFKMSAYSHREHNQIRFRTRDHILDRYRSGKDLFDRPNEKYSYMENNLDVPQLLRVQSKRFMYMIKRSNLTDAGFIDA